MPLRHVGQALSPPGLAAPQSSAYSLFCLPQTTSPALAEEFEERAGGVAQGAAGGVEEADLSFHVDLLDAHLAEQALLDFLFDTHARQEGYAGIVLHELADGFDGWHLNVHAERDFVAREFR